MLLSCLVDSLLLLLVVSREGRESQRELNIERGSLRKEGDRRRLVDYSTGLLHSISYTYYAVCGHKSRVIFHYYFFIALYL